MYHPKKSLLLAINVHIKILTGHFQYHQTQFSTDLDINPSLKADADIKTHFFQKAKNHLTDVVPPPTPGGSSTTTSSSDLRIVYNTPMNLMNSPPTAVSSPTQTYKQDKPPSLSPVPTLQVGQAANHVDSNENLVPAIITKVMICTIFGEPMYLNKGTPNQTHQANIDFLYETSNPKLFLSTSPFSLSILAPPPKKNLWQLLALVPTAILLQPILFTPPPLLTNVFNRIFNPPSPVVKL